MDGVDVLTRGEVLESALQAREYLVTCGVPAALSARDPRLWGRREVAPRAMSWLDLAESSRRLLPRLDELVAEARAAGLDHVALVAVGAESLAARSLAGAGPHTLITLDGNDAGALESVLARLERALVVLSSKRGVSLEGDAYRRIFEARFREHGLSEAEIAGRFVVLTDHGSPLDAFARKCGYQVGLTDPELPGHFGALSAYGVVPALLAGVDVNKILNEAASVLPALNRSEDNPGLLLGAILGGCANHAREGVVRDKLVIRDSAPHSALSGWVTQLLATATSRHGRGILPMEPAGRVDGPDLHALTINPGGMSIGDGDTSVWGPLGAQFTLWEYAASVAGWLMGVNPFEAPSSVSWEGEDDAAALLRTAADGPLPTGAPTCTDGDIDIYADVPVRNLSELLEVLTLGIPNTGYVTVIDYLTTAFPAAQFASAFARRAQRPVAFGSGPGYLQGTGAYYKVGPPGGTFMVVTGEPEQDHPVPGRPYTLGMLRQARALADVQALRRRGLPVSWVHLRDPAEGALRLMHAVHSRHHPK